MNQMTFPSYAELTTALQNTQSDFEAAEVHGLLCGIICSTSDKTNIAWEKLISGPQKNEHTHELLQQLYATSYQKMGEFSFEFALLLPTDKVDINIRTEALGLWCQGFVTGLQHAPALEEIDASSEAIDALSDITEIAQVNYGDIPNNEENETAYVELVEYVRLAVLMIFHELKLPAPENNSTNNNLLH